MLDLSFDTNRMVCNSCSMVQKMCSADNYQSLDLNWNLMVDKGHRSLPSVIEIHMNIIIYSAEEETDLNQILNLGFVSNKVNFWFSGNS